MSIKKKYTLELKLEIVERHINGYMGCTRLSKEYSIHETNIMKWVNQYKEHGVGGLIATNDSYSGDFKVHVVEYMRETGTSASKTAIHFNIPSYSTVLSWERIYLEEGAVALTEERRGRKRAVLKNDNVAKKRQIKDKKLEEDIISEVQQLRMENEYLKKLLALI